MQSSGIDAKRRLSEGFEGFATKAPSRGVRTQETQETKKGKTMILPDLTVYWLYCLELDGMSANEAFWERNDYGEN